MTHVRGLMAAVVLALPLPATAQQIDRVPIERFRKWDIGGGLGIRFGERDDAVVPAGSWMAEGSRYWTTHFKTSIAVTTAGQESSPGYGYDPRAAFTTYTETKTSPAAYGRVITSAAEKLEVRPVVGGGFKSYFGNGRAFMRSELLVAFGPSGTPHAVLQIGSGVDF